jgi:hypothetical protein
MVYFYTKNTNLGIFRSAFGWKMLVFFLVILKILQPFGILYCHLVYEEKSGNTVTPGCFIELWRYRLK